MLAETERLTDQLASRGGPAGPDLPPGHPVKRAHAVTAERLTGHLAAARVLLVQAIGGDRDAGEQARPVWVATAVWRDFLGLWARIEESMERSMAAGGDVSRADRSFRSFAAGSDIDTGAWKAAEELAASALRRSGFADARTTPAGADGGVDVSGAAMAAQVKYTDRPVGRPAVQQLSGAAGSRTTAFFSASGYSAQAVAFGDQAGMALFLVRLPDSVSAVNACATRMVRGRFF
jgi:hypothetical protein